jgi:hypothetical protein
MLYLIKLNDETAIVTQDKWDQALMHVKNNGVLYVVNRYQKLSKELVIIK